MCLAQGPQSNKKPKSFFAVSLQLGGYFSEDFCCFHEYILFTYVNVVLTDTLCMLSYFQHIFCANCALKILLIQTWPAVILLILLCIASKPFTCSVPRSPSYGVYISQLMRFARVCSNVDDLNNRNLFLNAKLLKQGYRYHKIRIAFSKFYHRLCWKI